MKFHPRGWSNVCRLGHVCHVCHVRWIRMCLIHKKTAQSETILKRSIWIKRKLFRTFQWSPTTSWICAWRRTVKLVDNCVFNLKISLNVATEFQFSLLIGCMQMHMTSATNMTGRSLSFGCELLLSFYPEIWYPNRHGHVVQAPAEKKKGKHYAVSRELKRLGQRENSIF